MSVRIKICGITRVADAVAAADAGAHAVGVIFVPHSKRFVTPETAAAIAAAVADRVLVFGVFQDQSARHIIDTVRLAGLTAVQLHGDEPASMLDELAELGVPIVKAFALTDDRLPPAVEPFRRRASGSPHALLLDKAAGAARGGTGKTLDWRRLAAEVERAGRDRLPPLSLAGGLTPENVTEAIGIVRPDWVDTAGGVESAPGVKDHGRIRAFVAAADRFAKSE